MKVKKIGTISGVAVFFLGIGLLGFTFFVTYSAFTNPESLVPFTKLVPVPEPRVGAGPEVNLGAGPEALVSGLVSGLMDGLIVLFGGLIKAVGYSVAIGLLVVMWLVGGRIAERGVLMFRAQSSQDSGRDA